MKLKYALLAVALTAGTITAAAACGSSGGESSFSSGVDAGDNFDSGPSGSLTGGDGAVITSGSCTPLSCKDVGASCGLAGDGCGGKIDCGGCTAPETCGGGGTPSACGGSAGCVPKTCTEMSVACGPSGDGCGGTIPNCGTCTFPAICGGGGPSACGGGDITSDGGVFYSDGGACIARTGCNPGECGPVADGCGGILTCGTCTAGDSCGGGGVASMCGAPACTKKTSCGSATCGYVSDGCGGLIDCGGTTSCTKPAFCGGGGPNICGVGVSAPTCTGFCLDQQACTASTLTTITGTVFAPNDTLPLPNALVYVPNGDTKYPYGLTAFTDGIGAGATCDTCAAEASGAPLVKTTSNFDGSFTLANVPAGVDFPIVIQLGHWRKVVNVPAITKCTTKPVDPTLTRFPKTQNEGGSADNIPLFAISTGAADGLECVLRKMGIADSEFGNPTDTGRVRFYKDSTTSTAADTGPGATISPASGTTTPVATQLYDTSTATATPELNNYDAVIFACRGGATNKDDRKRSLSNVQNYVNSGGRVFATHYSYVWLDPQSEETTPRATMWPTAATWSPDSTSTAWNATGSSTTGLVSTTVNGGIFAKWLAAPAVNATTTGSTVAAPLVQIFDPRNDVDIPIGAGTEQWIQQNISSTSAPLLHMAFNTPVGAATQCGRVIYSDFHISVGSSTKGTSFPNECVGGSTMSAQEKILAYMIFDLTQCITPVTPPPPPPCNPGTCAGIVCGPVSDGCGNTINCNDCPTGEICTGTPAACITPPCTKATCPAGGSCGPIPDGCGGSLDCGPCPTGMTCGGAGPSMCGTTTCTPQPCPASIKCGPAADGCGGLIASCGTCTTGTTCGGGGTSGVCGAPNCTPRTCTEAKATCGDVADGCGGIISCGTCATGQTCGGGGVANQCSASIPR